MIDEEDTVVTATDGETSSSGERQASHVGQEKHDAPKDLRGQLRAAVDHHKEPSEARRAAAAGRDRAGDGKFAPASTDAKNTALRDARGASSAEGKADVSNDGKSTEAPAALVSDQTQRVPAPEALSKDIRAIWDTLDPKIQAEFVRRETDSAKGVEQLKNRYRPLDEAFTNYRPLLQQRGLTEVDAVKQLFGWHEALAGPNKVQAAKALLQAHGIDPSTLAAGHNGASQDQTHQPQAEQLPPVFHELTNHVGELRSQFQQDRERRANEEIVAFSADRPHFGAVRVEMAKMIQAGMATSLDEAYQRAVWANPETRAAIQQEEVAKRAAETKAEAERKQAESVQTEEARKRKEADDLERARRANVSPRTAAPTGPVSAHRPKGKSVGSDLRDAIRQASGTV